MLDGRLDGSLWAMRAALGTGAIGFGLERFNMPGTLARGGGLLEFIAGLLVFTPLTGRAATFLSGWWLLLALGAASARSPALAACHVLLAAGAFALARLTGLNEAERPGRPAVSRTEAARRGASSPLAVAASPEAPPVARPSG